MWLRNLFQSRYFRACQKHEIVYFSIFIQFTFQSTNEASSLQHFNQMWERNSKNEFNASDIMLTNILLQGGNRFWDGFSQYQINFLAISRITTESSCLLRYDFALEFYRSIENPEECCSLYFFTFILLAFHFVNYFENIYLF